MGGCMLIRAVLGQLVALDEPERYIAGEHWRDDWADKLVSAFAVHHAVGCSLCADASVYLDFLLHFL